MTARCDWTRERLTDPIGRAGSWPADVRNHLDLCASCAEYARVIERVSSRLAHLPRVAAPPELAQRVHAELSPAGRDLRLARWIGELARVPAPYDLDGRVVAALNAGHQQDRATEQLRSISRLATPAELEAAVAHGLKVAAAEAGLLQAPGELDRRVAADLRAGFRRSVGRLAQALSCAPENAAPATPRRRRTRRNAVLPLAALLTALLFGWAAGLAPIFERSQRHDRAALSTLELDFQVESARVDQLSQMGQRLLSGLSGGLVDALTPGVRSAVRAPVDRVGSTRSQSETAAQMENGAGSRREQPTHQASTSNALLERIPRAAQETRFSGERLVKLVDPPSGAELVLRERVSSDGQGRFSVDPLGVIEAPEGSEALGDFFPTLQKGREGFIFRYRDFSIRDLERFYLRYVTRVVSEGGLVAGRECVMLDVRRAQAPERYYRAAIDLQSGLVLACEERLVASDALLSKVAFESIEFGPGLDLPVLSGGPSAWQQFDPQGDPPAQVDFPLRPPSFVPSGYSLERTATHSGALGIQWVEYVYSDGVEQLFFLHSEASSAGHPSGVQFGDRMCVASMGSWTMVEGQVDGTPVLAVGRLDPQDLLLLVKSAFD